MRVIAALHEIFPKNASVTEMALLIAIPAFILGAVLTAVMLWVYRVFGRLRLYVGAAVLGAIVLRPLLGGSTSDVAVELPSVAGYAGLLSAVGYLLRSQRRPRSLVAKSVFGGLLAAGGALLGSFVAFRLMFT